MRQPAHSATRRGLLISGLTASLTAAQQPRSGKPSRILVFDVNETLLDLDALKPHFQAIFGDAGTLRDWFNNVIQYSLVLTLAGPYKNFAEVARAALTMTAEERGRKLSEEEARRILSAIRTLPAHPDAAPNLSRLKMAGFRMVTLTNSPPATVEAQLSSANLQRFFERSFSVDAVQKFKPAPEPYRFVARELGVETRALRLIAAHAWDVAGALQSGCAAAFVARPGKALFPLSSPPDIVGKNLTEIADAILKSDSPQRSAIP